MASQLKSQTSLDSLLDSSSESYRATRSLHESFGQEPVYILIRGDLGQLLLSNDVLSLLSLEGCISGLKPAGAPKPRGVCAEFAREKPVKAVYGPATFINQAAVAIAGNFEKLRRKNTRRAERAARAARELALSQGLGEEQAKWLAAEARKLVYAQFLRDSLKLALRYGLTSIPQLNNPEFVTRLVFDSKRGAGTPKARFAYLFPSRKSALIQVRLKPGLSAGQREQALEMIERATREPGQRLEHGSYTVAGAEPLAQGVSRSLSAKLTVMLLLALVVMAATLVLTFNVKRRLLPLVLALSASCVAFGALYAVGQELTLASVAVLPVMLGLGVDYAIQFQASYQRARRKLERIDALREAVSDGLPSIAQAAIASLAGLSLLLLAPLPLIRSFGAVLVAGVAISFIYAVVAGSALLTGPGLPAGRLNLLRKAYGRILKTAGSVARMVATSSAVDGARSLLRKAASRSLSIAYMRPRPVLLVALLLALLGVALSSQITSTTEIQKLLPESQREVANIALLQDTTGIAGEIDLTVTGRDVMAPEVISWLASYERRMLAKHGYREARGCKDAYLCPGFSLTRLLEGGGGKKIKPSRLRALVAAMPAYFRQAFISSDGRTASFAFGMPVMDLTRQKELIDDLKSNLDPPEGIRAELAGLPVVAAEANSELNSASHWLPLAGLACVFIILLILYRSVRRALLPLAPIAMALGWSGLLLFLLGVKLNPMTATLGVLVLAISTEFSVILASRYFQARHRGLGSRLAIEYVYKTTGMAVAVSALTATLGFAVLIASDVAMFSQFGVVTVIDLAVSLAGVALVLPAAISYMERFNDGVRRDGTQGEKA